MMAKKAAKKTAKKSAKGRASVPVPAVYYVKQTEKGQHVKPEERAADMKRIDAHIKRLGARCMLYAGNDQEFISLVSGLTDRAQKALAEVIGKNGNVTAAKFIIFKGGP